MSKIKIEKDEAGVSALVSGIPVEPILVNTHEAFVENVEKISIREINENDPLLGKVISKIHYTNFLKANGSTPVDADDIVADITAQLNQAAPTDVAAGYKGLWNAATNTPDLTGDFNNGDWFYVGFPGTYNGVDFSPNDIIKKSESGFDLIPDPNVRIDTIESSAIGKFDIVVDGDYLGSIKTGSELRPFTDINTALANSSPGDSILLKGDLRMPNSTDDLHTLPHSLNIYATEDCVTGYQSYNATNGSVWRYVGTDYTAEFKMHDVKIRNAGKYGIHLTKGAKWEGRRLNIQYCGWDGDLSVFNPYLPTTLSGATYGPDSTDLTGFYPSTHASNGGGIRIEEFTNELDVATTITNCLRSLRLQDCGVGGNGFQTRNRLYGNIESGLYYALGTTFYGCQNMTALNNYIAFNANNGILIVGGINNEIGVNKVHSNWNAGICNFAGANVTVRDSGIYNNNRSSKNGIGNNGDAMASIQYNDAFNYLAATFAVSEDRRFLMSINNAQVHNTGIGGNTETTGIYFATELSNLPASDKNIININNVEFIGQDVGIDMSDLDTTNITILKGQNEFISVGTQIKEPTNGYYYELPFSNHLIKLEQADFNVTNTGNVLIKEGPNGSVLNPYFVNELQAIAKGSEIAILLKGSKKIQFTVPVSGCSINGIMVNSVLNLALEQINNILENTSGFASNGNPVTDFNLIGNDLTITLQDNTSFTVDVTTLGVDENKFVSSGQLNGSNLELTMNDSSIITIDASNMVNGSQLPAISNDWFIAYGNNAGDKVVYPSVVADIKAKQPFYNADFLEKGEEYVFTHEVGGTYILGGYTGNEETSNEVDIMLNNKWGWNFKFFTDGSTNDSKVNETSVGVDVASRFATGYNITNSTVIALRWGEDGYVRLYDVSNGNRVLIGQTNTVQVGVNDELAIFFGGDNQPNAKFPVMVKRYADWTIAHDFDNSETSILDGVETDTVLRSNISISPGEKALLNFNYFGRGESVGLSYSGLSTGVSNAYTNIGSRLFYNAAELLRAVADGATGGDWLWNTSAANHYDPNGDGSNVGYWNGSGVDLGLISFRYQSDNSMEVWHETNNEKIATLAVNLDGSPINIFVGFNEAHPYNRIPSISKQTIGQGSQPTVSLKPEMSDQSFNITEGTAFTYQILRDSGSVNIVNQYAEFDAPSWVTLDQATGILSGTAPAFSGGSDSYDISCRAYNAGGGASDSFTVTINVDEIVYTNTKSLQFRDGASSYLGGNAALVTALERSGNGSGSADASTISMWIKGSALNQGQTLLYFGGNDTANTGHIELKQTNHNGLKRLRFRIGTTNNYLQFTTPSGSIDPTVFQHIVIVITGGETGNQSTQMSSYYSTVEIYINKVLQATSNTHSNYGYTGSIVGQNFRIGRYTSGNYARGFLINQLTIWNSNQSSNVEAIYNNGIVRDVLQLSANTGGLDANYEEPDHHYEFEDSTSTIQDLVGTAHLVGYNFNSTTDLVSQTPPTS